MTTLTNYTMLTCKVCKRPFSFSTADAETFAQRGWSPPWRCGACRERARRIEEEQGARTVDGFADFDRRHQR